MLDNPELAADNFRIFLRGVRNSLKTDLAVYIAAPLDEKIMSSKLIAAITELGELALYSKGNNFQKKNTAKHSTKPNRMCPKLAPNC